MLLITYKKSMVKYEKINLEYSMENQFNDKIKFRYMRAIKIEFAFRHIVVNLIVDYDNGN